MIKATDKQWNSPNTLYIARRLQEIADGRRIAVLDVGCGDGTILEHLLDYDYDLYGYDVDVSKIQPYLEDLEDRRHEIRRKKLASYLGDSYDERIRVTASERTIPFDDNSFDVLYANQVFEHIRFFDKTISECARVLRPGGVLLANFPLATVLLEPHIGIPMIHWIPPGKLRVRCLQLWCAVGLLDKFPPSRNYGEVWKKASALETALFQERFLQRETYYRFMNEVVSVSKHYFEACEVDTGPLIRAKIDLMSSEGTGRAWLGPFLRLVNGEKLCYGVTYLANAAFCMRNPRQPNLEA